MRLEDLVDDLGELVTCESPSSDLDAVARSAEVVAAVGERVMGAPAERLVLDGRTHLRWRFGDGDRVLLLGHHDTVWPLGSLAEHPWQVVDGRAQGPGCFDMKAGLVQIFHAVASLADRRGVTVLVTGDEELGAPSSRPLIEEEARRAGHVLVLEASADGGALKVQRKGVSLYEVIAHGRAAHAGLEPHLGANATVAMADVVLALAGLSEGGAGRTVVPTMLTSGVAANTVPALATLRVDVRCVTRADQQEVDDLFRALRTSVAGVRLEVRRLAGHPPLERASSARLFELVTDVAATLGLPAPAGVAVGGASDGNLAAGAGALVLDGLGAVGGGAHAPGEHVLVDHLLDRTRLLAALTGRLVTGLDAPMNPDPAIGGVAR